MTLGSGKFTLKPPLLQLFMPLLIMKKKTERVYYLTRFADHQRWTLATTRASPLFQGQNKGPYWSYIYAKILQYCLNKRIERHRKLNPPKI